MVDFWLAIAVCRWLGWTFRDFDDLEEDFGTDGFMNWFFEKVTEMMRAENKKLQNSQGGDFLNG